MDIQNKRRTKAGFESTLSSDPFVLKEANFENKSALKQFLQPYVNEANNHTEVLITITVDVSTKGNPNATITTNWFDITNYNASELSKDRMRAIEKVLTELGV